MIRSIPDPDRFFRSFRELGDGLILGDVPDTTSGRVAVLDLRSGTFLGRALPRPVNYRGELYALDGRVASVQDYSARVEFHELRHSSNASQITDLEAGPGQQIELTGDYLATATSVSIGGTHADFTINPATADYPGWTPRPASITVTVPDLGVGSHRVRVDGPLDPSLDNAENQLAIIPAKPRHDLEVQVRSDSAGQEARVSVNCAAPSVTCSRNTRATVLRTNCTPTLGVVAEMPSGRIRSAVTVPTTWISASWGADRNFRASSPRRAPLRTLPVKTPNSPLATYQSPIDVSGLPLILVGR